MTRFAGHPRFAMLLVTTLVAAAGAAAADPTEIARIQATTWAYVVFAVTVSLVKIVAMVLGYLVAKLGFTTMMAGVQGKDAVEMSAIGMRLKFKGVTPGIALGILGVLMMGWGISRQTQFSASVEQAGTRQVVSSADTETPSDVRLQQAGEEREGAVDETGQPRTVTPKK